MSASSLFPEPPATSEEPHSSSPFGATQSLYRKYRPQTFETNELVGQDAIVRTLKNAIRLDRVAHAYLFTGPRGTGKTTTARLLAKAVNCLDPDPDARPCNQCAACVAINTGATTDIIEIDAASNRGIDDIRELRERVKFAPTFLKTKFYIVDEAHQITGAAANAFLKTLEEPPPHTKFILATTDPEQLLPTIVSRCQRFDFKRFSRETIVDHLVRVADQESLPIDRSAIAIIAEHAGGSMRDALGLLDQVSSYREQDDSDSTHPVSAADVQELLGVARSERVVRLAEALADLDAGAGLALINEAFDAGEDPRQLNRQFVALLRAVMFQVASGAPADDPDVGRLATRFSLGTITKHSARFSEIDYRIRHASLPQLPLEIAFVQATLDVTSSTDSAIERRVSRDRRETSPPAQPVEQERPRPKPVQSDSPAPNRERPAETTQANSAPPPTASANQQPSSTVSEEPESSASPPVSASGDISVDLLHDLWPKIRLDVKARDRRIEALLSSCDPARVDGTAITLVTSYKFHWEKMNEDATRDLLQHVIGRLVQQTVSVTTVMRDAVPASPPRALRAESPRSDTPPEVPRATPERTAEEETLLEAARNIFDAEELTPKP